MEIKNMKIYKSCLIVVDMVNGFVREGMLHDESIANIIPRQIELIKEAHQAGKAILFVKDTHQPDSTEFVRFRGSHCLAGTTESELVEELKPWEEQEDTFRILKNSTSFMESPTFRAFMEKQPELQEFDVVGCCTDICVVNGSIALANYLDERNHPHTIRVHEDAIATYAEENRKEYVEAAKILMKQQGIELVKKK